jgi:hypothetical protein
VSISEKGDGRAERFPLQRLGASTIQAVAQHR